MLKWKFQLLGDFTAFAPDGSVLAISGRKHRALIAILLLSESMSVTRDYLLNLLWSSRFDTQARTSLRGVLSEIKREYRPFGACPIAADRTHVFIAEKINPEIDIDPLISGSNDQSANSLAVTVRLNGGELLSSLKIDNEQAFEHWKVTEQERVRKAYRKILWRYLNLRKGSEDTVEFEYTANRMLELDDADEDAHRALMQLYHEQGNRSLALNQFKTCEQNLRENHDSAVSEATADLAKKIRAVTAGDNQNFDTFHYETAQDTATGRSEVSLAVLPFSLQSGLELPEDIGHRLAGSISDEAFRFRWFRSIPSSETSRVHLPDLGLSSMMMATGAKYVLDGHVEKSREDYVLIIKLIDGENSGTVWCERVPLTPQVLADPMLINEKILGQLDVKLRSNEIAQAHRLNREPSTGYEYTLLAMSNMYELSKSTYQDTETLFQNAINHSPNNAWAYSFWSLWKMFCLGQNWVDDYETGFEAANKFADIARNRDPEDAIAWVIAGHFSSFWKLNLEQGQRFVNIATDKNPYSSFVWMLSSATYAYLGEPEEALRRLEISYSLSPIDTSFMFMYDSAACLAHLYNRDAHQAEKYGRQTISDAPQFSNGYKQLLVALGHLGKTTECQRYLKLLLELEPGFNIYGFLQKYPFGKPEDADYFREGMELAGAPEGSDAARHLVIDE